MKTSEQLSKEIFEKISKREAARMRLRKRVRRVFAAVVVVAFLVPATVYLSLTEEFNRHRPLSYPFGQEEEKPVESDDSSDLPQTQKENHNRYEIVLPT